jgi:NitT/TauT family transport system ATP-binding protein
MTSAITGKSARQHAGMSHIADRLGDNSLGATASSADSMPTIRIEHLWKGFDVSTARTESAADPHMWVLEDINLDINERELVSLIGPSGCGKTTLLRIIAGLVSVDEGAVFVQGRAIKAPRRDLCMVFQNFGLLPWRSVLANVSFPLQLDGTPKRKREEIARHYIERVGLRGFERHFPHELSGGMQQRVGIARALVRKPLVLLMDEPFAALDAQTRERLQEDFLQLWNDLKTTVVFVTHSIDEALVLSDRIAVMSSRPGSMQQIFTMPFGKPRTIDDVRAQPQFAQYRQLIRDLLRQGESP